MNKRQLFTPEEDQRIKQMLSDGQSHKEIAETLKRAKGSVTGRVHKLLGRTPPSVPSQPRAPSGLRGKVSCLGGCGALFDSPDRLRIRMCPACKRTHGRSGLPEAFESAI